MPDITLNAVPGGRGRLLTSDGERHEIGDTFHVTDRELQQLEQSPGVDITVNAVDTPDTTSEEDQP